jgi:hypothetical protein
MLQPTSTYFKDWLFYEKGHTYKNTKHPELKFRSSTGVKAQFVRDFRERYWAAWHVIKKKYSRNLRSCDASPRNTAPYDHFIVVGKKFHYEEIWQHMPTNCQKVLDEWELESTFGKGKGNNIHDFLEDLTNQKVNTYAGDERIFAYRKNAWDYFQKMPPNGFPQCEVIVGDLDWMCCGAVDRIDHIDQVKGIIDIIDYKGDKDFQKSGGLYNLLEPFDHLEDNSLNQYRIQVNIYREIVEKNTPYKVRNMTIINITNSGWEAIDCEKLDVLNR